MFARAAAGFGCAIYSSMRPPAATIFSRAPALTFTPRTVTAWESSPLASSFAGPFLVRITPASASDSGVISVPSGMRLRSSSVTTCDSTRNMFVKPRFGRRRVSGIWPPSNCGLPPPGPWCPARALMPLCPLPDVLPVPEPGPRPSRLRFLVEPGAGERLCRPILSLLATSLLLLDGRHLDQVAHFLDLTAQRRRILLDDDGLVVVKSDRRERQAHRRGTADAAPHLLDPHLARRRRLFLGRSLRPARAVPNECSRH